MIMKKITVFIAAVIAVSMLASCSEKSGFTSESSQKSSKAASTTTQTVTETQTTTVSTKSDADKKAEEELAAAQQIEEYISTEDYSTASSELSAFRQKYGKDETYNRIKTELEGKVLDQLRSNADQKRSDGSIMSAVEYVKGEMSYYRELDGVKTYYDGLVDEYVSDVIIKAQDAIKSGNYEQSEQLISAAKKNVGSDSKKLTEAESDLAQYMPTYLFELDMVNNEGEKPSMGFSSECRDKYKKAIANVRRHNNEDKVEIKDSVGNTYLYSYYIGSAAAGIRKESFSEYLINGKYDTFSGVVAGNSNLTFSGPTYFIVYGDGKELYRSPVMDKGSKPQKFSVNIKGVDTFRIQYYHEEEKTHQTATIFNGAFTITPKF